MNPLKYFMISVVILEKIWVYLAIAALLSFAGSFCWWRRHGGKPPSSPLAAILPFLGLRTKKVIFCGIAGTFFVSLLPVFVLVPFMIAFSLPFIAIGNLVRKDPDLREGWWREMLFFAFLVLLLSLGLLAPLHLLGVATYFMSGRPAGSTLEALVIGKAAVDRDTVIGFTGIFAISLFLFFDAFWRLRQARQVENLPSSKVRALAPGLVEVKGRARKADDNAPVQEPVLRLHMEMMESFQHKVAPFYLEDATGRVLIKPGRSYIRVGWLTDLLSLFTGFHEIVLARRVVRNSAGGITRSLMDGDPVYVIGNAEVDADQAGARQIVIKPKKGLPGTPFFSRGKDIHNAFFISDTGEERAKDHIMRGAGRAWLLSLLWLLVSVVLIWSASLPVRQDVDPESWRNARWKGPEPRSDDAVDYSRDMRLFRFKKYAEALKPDSHEAIPALIEAIGYKNTRFREPATQALLNMLPAAKEQAQGAIPHLIENLGDRRAQVIQLSIRALAKFGPLAKDAVPALIGQLRRTEKTNTYEIDAKILRHDAAVALGEIGPAAGDAVPELRKALADRSPYVRDAAARAIGQIAGPSIPGRSTL